MHRKGVPKKYGVQTLDGRGQTIYLPSKAAPEEWTSRRESVTIRGLSNFKRVRSGRFSVVLCIHLEVDEQKKVNIERVKFNKKKA